jgi:hypothetical protein
MRKKTHKQQLSTDDLLKTKDIELTEKELGKVSAGRKGNAPVEYIKLTMKEVLLS